jgi:peptide-methionine (S)-S-oxide reductase
MNRDGKRFPESFPSFQSSGKIALLVVTLALAATVAWNRDGAAGDGKAVPGPAVDAPLAANAGEQTAVLSGGCFWGIQAVFKHVKGVKGATSGYSGGVADTAEYETVSTGTTGLLALAWTPKRRSACSEDYRQP